jgi:hypothetical protein
VPAPSARPWLQLVLLCLVVAGFFLSAESPFSPGTAITGARELLFWWASADLRRAAFRFYAIRLAAFFHD